MTDLLDQDAVDDFRAAMRDVTDTFHKSEVTLHRPDGSEVDLVAGVAPDDAGDGGSHGEMGSREDGTETLERWVVSFHREYLAEKGLVDPETDTVLIGDEDRIVYGGRRFAILRMTDKAIFRGAPILVLLKVGR